MAEKIIKTSKQSSMAEAPFDAIRVMVVDDDIICLSIVAGMLKTWKYQVVTVKNAEDALITLRSRSNFFHLIITDVHMPVMDGFEFQKQVRKEFKLPIIMMSADDKESSMLRGLQGGASFYIVKPVRYDDLKDLWQYAVGPRSAKSAAIREIEYAQGATRPEKLLTLGAVSVAVVQEEKLKKRESKKKAEVKVDEVNETEKDETDLPRKSKIVWTTALHNDFLEAIRKIGLERAVPKRILEQMNEPGLTRENVASHLQKYRIFLKRVTEATCSSDGSSNEKNLIERTLRSSFATGHPSLMINALQQGLLGNIRLPPSFGATMFSSQQASNSNPRLELGHGQSQLGESSSYFQQSTFGNNKSPYQVPDIMAKHNFSTSGILGSNNIHDIRNKGSSSRSGRTPDLSSSYNITDQVGFSGAGVSSGLNGSYDGNMINSSYYSQGGYSQAGLGRTNQFSPRFSNVTQQENNLGTGGLFDYPMNNAVTGENVFPPQSAPETDVYDIFQNQQKNNIPASIEEGAGEEAGNHGHAIHSYPVEQNPLENQQYSNQIESNGSIWGYNTNQLDDYYPSFNAYPDEQQGGGGLQDHGSYDGYPNANPSWNQGVGDDIADSVFGPGGY